jgi:hypothetical protein
MEILPIFFIQLSLKPFPQDDIVDNRKIASGLKCQTKIVMAIVVASVIAAVYLLSNKSEGFWIENGKLNAYLNSVFVFTQTLFHLRSG